MIYKFAGIDQLSWTEGDIEESNITFSKEYYEARQVPDSGEIYMIQYYCHGSVPPTAYTVVVDFQTGLVTVCKAQFCLGYNPREAVSYTHLRNVCGILKKIRYTLAGCVRKKCLQSFVIIWYWKAQLCVKRLTAIG